MYDNFKDLISVVSIHLYLQVGGLIVELSSDVDVSSTGSHGPPSDQAAFDQLVWVIPHDLPVLTGARFSLICIHHQILWANIRKQKQVGVINITVKVAEFILHKGCTTRGNF